MAHRHADIDLVTLEQKDFNNWLDTVRGVEEEEQALAAQAAAENAQLAAEAHEEREPTVGFDD
jgi:heme/copper-type cytochrome/quinol oxidase subunit 2